MIKRPVSKSERKRREEEKNRGRLTVLFCLCTPTALCASRFEYTYTHRCSSRRNSKHSTTSTKMQGDRERKSERGKECASNEIKSIVPLFFVVYLLFREGQLHQWPPFWHTPSDIATSNKDKKKRKQTRREESDISDRKTFISFLDDYDEPLTSCSRVGRCQRMCRYLPAVVKTICYHDWQRKEKRRRDK